MTIYPVLNRFQALCCVFYFHYVSQSPHLFKSWQKAKLRKVITIEFFFFRSSKDPPCIKKAYFKHTSFRKVLYFSLFTSSILCSLFLPPIDLEFRGVLLFYFPFVFRSYHKVVSFNGSFMKCWMSWASRDSCDNLKTGVSQLCLKYRT